jgi:phenol 2-monooxygenase
MAMQFHLNGFKPGDPTMADAAPMDAADDTAPAVADVLIVGCGPAGLTLAAQLATFPHISTVIIEQKDGPLRLGQADGIACRTMEMFEAFGFADDIAREAYWVNETVFWKPDAADGARITRAGRIQDVEDGLSEMPHVILNQARVHDRYLRLMAHAPRPILPLYARRVVRIERSADATATHPVTVTMERTDAAHEGEVETLRARYVIGCDGARSRVRQAMGLALQGDSANQAWGVMDVLAVTDFPDIRFKAAIQSQAGSILIIPREGGYLTRFYVELEQLNEGERITDREITIDQLIATAQRSLRPYTLDVKDVVWWSRYVIGQRLCDRFDDAAPGRQPRIFIAGDACHTHSPKAGQGMNVSMQDSFNLGWKLEAVIAGRAKPALLATYSAERQAIAKELIDFDREFAAMFSAHKNDADPAKFQRYFVKQGRFTAGTETRYQTSMICGDDKWQHLARGLVVGMRFHSAPVLRLGDAKLLQLGHEIKADGRWRLLLFAGMADDGGADFPVARLCRFLRDDAASPVHQYTPAGADIDSAIDVRAVFQRSHEDLAIEAMPDLLRPAKGKYGLHDYEKVFCAKLRHGADIFALREIDREAGCMVVVRPDQYIAHVLPMDGTAELAAFFQGVLVDVGCARP